MNLKGKTTPELLDILQDLKTLKPLNINDTTLVDLLMTRRSFSRYEKQSISQLCAKYRFQGDQSERAVTINNL